MKVIYKMLLFSLLVASCKMPSNEEVKLEKKTNILEHTKWKASGASAYEGDIVLDFHTSDSVREYAFLNGVETLVREGSYKMKGKARVKIKWGELVGDRVSGIINNKTMELKEEVSLKKTKYYKIGEY